MACLVLQMAQWSPDMYSTHGFIEKASHFKKTPGYEMLYMA
jgi:hypothetical protein